MFCLVHRRGRLSCTVSRPRQAAPMMHAMRECIASGAARRESDRASQRSNRATTAIPAECREVPDHSSLSFQKPPNTQHCSLLVVIPNPWLPAGGLPAASHTAPPSSARFRIPWPLKKHKISIIQANPITLPDHQIGSFNKLSVNPSGNLSTGFSPAIVARGRKRLKIQGARHAGRRSRSLMRDPGQPGSLIRVREDHAAIR